jgi:hypothetical protein
VWAGYQLKRPGCLGCTSRRPTSQLWREQLGTEDPGVLRVKRSGEPYSPLWREQPARGCGSRNAEGDGGTCPHRAAKCVWREFSWRGGSRKLKCFFLESRELSLRLYSSGLECLLESVLDRDLLPEACTVCRRSWGARERSVKRVWSAVAFGHLRGCTLPTRVRVGVLQSSAPAVRYRSCSVRQRDRERERERR